MEHPIRILCCTRCGYLSISSASIRYRCRGCKTTSPLKYYDHWTIGPFKTEDHAKKFLERNERSIKLGGNEVWLRLREAFAQNAEEDPMWKVGRRGL